MEERDEETDRGEEERRCVREAESSASKPTTNKGEGNKDVNVNRSVTNEWLDIMTTRCTTRNKPDGKQNQNNPRDKNDNEVPSDYARRVERMTDVIIGRKTYPAPS